MRKLVPLAALLLLLAGCGWSGMVAVSPEAEATPGPSEPVLVRPAPVESPAPAAEPAPSQTPTEPVRPVTIEPSAPAAPEPAATASPEPAATPVPTLSSSPAQPEDEDVLAAYHQAVEALRWFQAESLPYSPEQAWTEGEITYYRVVDPGITTLPDLRGYLKSLFSDELVDSLLPAEGGRYAELDGALYVQPVSRADDPSKGAETYQIFWEGMDKCVVRVTVEVLDPEQELAVVGSESYDFPYEKVGDKWIFTSFFLIR